MNASTTCEAGADPVDARARVAGTLKRLSRTGALPTLPSVASAALALARDPDADIDRMCQIVRTDIGLSARVLRLANSAALGRRTPARRLNEAVVTIGLRKTCDILVAACARQLYDTGSPLAEAQWRHALATAVASEKIARASRRSDPSRAFLPGLFHDVGRVAFLLADEVSLRVIDRMVDEGAGDRAVLEEEWYGFDHAQAGAELAEDWGLALEQCDAIRWHHDPESAGAAADLAAVINAADGVAYAIGHGVGIWPPASVGLAALGFDADAAQKLTEEIGEAFQENLAVLG